MLLTTKLNKAMREVYKLISNSSISACRDYFPQRVCKVFIHLCTEYEVKGGWQMRKYCPKTCGICKFFKRGLLNTYVEDMKREVEIIKEIQRH